jgi:flagellar basal-body rod protein FlgB
MRVNIPQSDLLGRLLDAAALRHRVIANNLANVNTPGYRRQEVSFEGAFARAMDQGEAKAAAVRPVVVEATGGKARLDGNTVDVDREMADLNKNALLYNAFNQFLLGQIAAMRSAITGR